MYKSKCLDQNVLSDVNSFSEVLLNSSHKDRDRKLQKIREKTAKEAAGQKREMKSTQMMLNVYIHTSETGPAGLTKLLDSL